MPRKRLFPKILPLGNSHFQSKYDSKRIREPRGYLSQNCTQTTFEQNCICHVIQIKHFNTCSSTFTQCEKLSPAYFPPVTNSVRSNEVPFFPHSNRLAIRYILS